MNVMKELKAISQDWNLVQDSLLKTSNNSCKTFSRKIPNEEQQIKYNSADAKYFSILKTRYQLVKAFYQTLGLYS